MGTELITTCSCCFTCKHWTQRLFVVLCYQ